MSRRSRSPGPIQNGPTAPSTRPRSVGSLPWISIDPSANGEPVAPPDFSDNANLPVPGVWYRYDPNDSLDDNPSAAGQYVKSDSTGLTWWTKTVDCDNTGTSGSNINRYRWDHEYSIGGRFATVLLRPDGTPLKWEDNFGLELLITQTGVAPTNGRFFGITIGIVTDNVLTVDGLTSNQIQSLWMKATYKNTAGSDALLMSMGSPHEQTGHYGSNDSVACMASWPAILTDDQYAAGAEVFPYNGVGADLDGSGRREGSTYTLGGPSEETIVPNYASDPMVNSQVMLFVAPTTRANAAGAITDDPTMEMSGWKLFYRLYYQSSRGFFPDYVPGRVNIYSGFTPE